MWKLEPEATPPPPLKNQQEKQTTIAFIVGPNSNVSNWKWIGFSVHHDFHSRGTVWSSVVRNKLWKLKKKSKEKKRFSIEKCFVDRIELSSFFELTFSSTKQTRASQCFFLIADGRASTKNLLLHRLATGKQKGQRWRRSSKKKFYSISSFYCCCCCCCCCCCSEYCWPVPFLCRPRSFFFALRQTKRRWWSVSTTRTTASVSTTRRWPPGRPC